MDKASKDTFEPSQKAITLMTESTDGIAWSASALRVLVSPEDLENAIGEEMMDKLLANIGKHIDSARGIRNV